MAKVVEFVDPSEARRRNRQVRAAQNKSDRHRCEPGKNEEIFSKSAKSEFRQIWKQVLETGAATFDAKKRKVWESQQLKQAGLKNKHVENMPYKMWLGVKNARQKRARRDDALSRETQLVTGQLQKKRQRNRFKTKYDASLNDGSYRDGTLHVRSNIKS